MLTNPEPRAETPSGAAPNSTHHRPATRFGATVTALALGGAFALAAPFPASAEDRPASYAEGQFLSGMLLGSDLAQFVEIEPAEARNDGSQPTQVDKDPLQADVLQTVELNEPVQADIGGVLQVGAVAQYAEANSDGSSRGASGAVADDGAIGVGDDTSTPPATATFDLSELAGQGFADTVTDLTLQFEAIAAQAEADLDVASGDYRLDGATLQLTSPAIARLTERVTAALDGLEDDILDLESGNGELLGIVNRILQGVDPLLSLVGTDANVSADIDTSNLESRVLALLTSQYGNEAVAFNLETGVVTIDLEELHGGSLNDLPVGTELLSDAVITQILTGITTTVTTLADQIVEKVEAELHNAKVTIHADLTNDLAQAPIVHQVCEVVNGVVSTPVLGPVLGNTDSTFIGLLLGTLGLGSLAELGSLTDGLDDLLGDYVVDGGGNIQEIIGFVQQGVQNTVCHNESTPLPALTSSVVLDIEGTIGQLLAGTAAKATAGVKVLGVVNHELDINELLDDLGLTLTDGLFDGDGAITQLIDALETGLVQPAVTGLLDGDDAVSNLLTDLLSIKVNLQELSTTGGGGMAVTSGGTFTQTAVRITAGDLATLNLAAATVGPNITQIIDPEDPEDPDGPDGPDGPNGPNGPSTPSATDRLAFTGVGIATLIAVILALLAAGAYMVRESRRRNHSPAHLAE